MSSILNAQRSTLLEYEVQINGTQMQPKHRLIIDEGAYSVCVPGVVTEGTVSFDVPPVQHLLTPGNKQYVWEATVGDRTVVAVEGELYVEQPSESIEIKVKLKEEPPLVDLSLEEMFARSGQLPDQTKIGGTSFQLVEQHGNYALYQHDECRQWVVCDPDDRSVRIVGDLLAEADRTGNEQFNKMKSEILNRTVGPVVEVIISGLADNQPVESKVDTGASCCSLDAQDIKITQDSYEQDHELVFFTFRGVKYRAIIDHYQMVKTADGTSNRPAVIFNVTCNGKLVENVAFNLDDRSAMDYDVLLGMNFLDQTDFLIDPSKALHENITLELLDTALQSLTEINR